MRAADCVARSGAPAALWIENRAEKVHVDDRPDRHHRSVGEIRYVECRAGVVDEATHRPERLVHHGEQPRHLTFEGHVGLHGDGSSTRGARHVDDSGRGPMILPVVDDNIVACLGEVLCGRSPDASPRSRDDRDRPAHLVHNQIIAYRVVGGLRKGAPVSRRPLDRPVAERCYPFARRSMNCSPTVPMPVIPSNPGAVFTVTSRDAQLPVPSQ